MPLSLALIFICFPRTCLSGAQQLLCTKQQTKIREAFFIVHFTCDFCFGSICWDAHGLPYAATPIVIIFHVVKRYLNKDKVCGER